MRPIDKDALLERIRCRLGVKSLQYATPQEMAIIKEIASAPTIEVPTWIPCSERMPEYGVPVLTWDGYLWAVEQRIPFVLDDDFNRIYSEWWVDADFDEDYEDAGYYPNLRDGTAIAWMPLPKPYINSSEKPNNCEHITEDGVTCAKYPACDDCLDNPLNKVKGSERLVKGSEKPNNSND